MSKDPTTTSQVQAYRFVLRRMESALVRKDAVMLHEPMRNHLRATAVGAILGVLGLAAFFVIGRFSPASEVNGNEIVIGSPSQSVFVVQDNPRQLIPVPNLTSARLLLVTTSSGQETPKAKTVADATLAGIPRAPTRGLDGVPPLPARENLIDGAWSVCDTAAGRRDLPNAPDLPKAESAPQLSTTVLVREQPLPGRPLGDEEALLVVEQSTGVTYLVWRGHRRQVDLHDSAVRTPYHTDNVAPRRVSAGLLNAIPPKRPLTLPPIPTRRPFPQLPGVQVGDVVQVKGVQDSFFLVLPQGRQRVEPAVAQMIRYRHGTTADLIVSPQDIDQVPEAPEASQLDFTDLPDPIPKILETTETPIACLTWQGPGKDPVITVYPEEKLPLGEGESPVPVRGASETTADSVVLQTTKGALVRGVVEQGQRPNTGTIWLVTGEGVRYGVPSLDVARALGLGEATSPAPESILSLLPIGTTLDPQRASEPYNPESARRESEQRTGG